MGYVDSLKEYKSLEKIDYNYIKHLERTLDEYTSELFQIKQKLREEISEKKLAQELLLEEESLTYGLLEFSPNLIVIIDKEGIILVQNQPIGSIHISKSFGKSIYDFVEVEERLKFKNFINNILKDEKREKFRFKFSDSTESIWTYEVYCSPIKTERTNFGFILIFTDITDQGFLDQLLAHSHKFLENSDCLIDKLPELKEFTDGYKKIIHENWFRVN